jgi:hypothetical protein
MTREQIAEAQKLVREWKPVFEEGYVCDLHTENLVEKIGRASRTHAEFNRGHARRTSGQGAASAAPGDVLHASRNRWGCVQGMETQRANYQLGRGRSGPTGRLFLISEVEFARHTLRRGKSCGAL